MSKSNIEKVIEKILFDDQALSKFLACKDQNDLYKYCLNKGSGYTREEFDEFVEETIVKANKEKEVVASSLKDVGGGSQASHGISKKIRQAFTKVLAAGLAALSLIAGNLNSVKATGASQGSSATKKSNNTKSNSVDEKGNSIKLNNVDAKGDSTKPNNVNAKGDNTKSNSSAVSKTRKVSLSKGKKISLGLGVAALILGGTGIYKGWFCNSVSEEPGTQEEIVASNNTDTPEKLEKFANLIEKPDSPKELKKIAKEWLVEFCDNRRLTRSSPNELNRELVCYWINGSKIAMWLHEELGEAFTMERSTTKEKNQNNDFEEYKTTNVSYNGKTIMLYDEFANFAKTDVDSISAIEFLDDKKDQFIYYKDILSILENTFVNDCFSDNDDIFFESAKNELWPFLLDLGNLEFNFTGDKMEHKGLFENFSNVFFNLNHNSTTQKLEGLELSLTSAMQNGCNLEKMLRPPYDNY